MIRFTSVAVLSVVLVSTAWLIAADDKPEEGFVPIFNGNDLEGWTVVGKPEGFTVKEGVLRSEGGKGGDWLRYDNELGDFILKMDWKVSKGGNSGVFIRSAKTGQPWVTGYEVQILDDESRDIEHCTGSLYGYFAVSKRPDTTPDTWHAFEIRCLGPKLTVISDGQTIVDVDQSKSEKAKDKPLKGHLGLQDSHSTPGHSIEFRNIRVKTVK